MRPKFLLALTAVTTLILAAVYVLHPKPAAVKPQMASEAVSAPPARSGVAKPPTTVFAPAPETVPSPEEKQAAIDRQLHQLQAWAEADDAAGLDNIVNELATNSERKIRFAAIAAAKQSGHREIIPALRDAAMRAEDLNEKKTLLDAADFLAGPTVSEQAANPQPLASVSP
ncbi:MAG: hypothetical protein P4N60_03495 [Verrucomicrobiae bacterium]|nr:hypothetical protein [Verrucomicrobiae bacterium]